MRPEEIRNQILGQHDKEVRKIKSAAEKKRKKEFIKKQKEEELRIEEEARRKIEKEKARAWSAQIEEEERKKWERRIFIENIPSYIGISILVILVLYVLGVFITCGFYKFINGQWVWTL